MFKDSREDIYDINVGFLGIFPRNIRVLIIGGGSVGFLKAKGLIKQGINNIDVISREFIDDFYKIKVNLICEEVSIDILNKYHFIVVAVEEYKDIKAMLDNLNKLYVICADSREGNCFVPVVIKSRGFSLGMTSNGSPKGTCFLRDKILDSVLRYDEFLYETRRIREEVKMLDEKDKIINFMYTDDFYFFYLKGKHNLVLELFFGGFYDKGSNKKKHACTGSGR